MDNVFELSQRLQHYRETNPKIIDHDSDAGQYGENRHTYCHIMYHISKELAIRLEHIGWHKIEVRGWHTTMDYRMIEISCVNWTLAAGTCTLSIKDDSVKDFKILEDEPTLQVLYG
jgi:hypothetical protein